MLRAGWWRADRGSGGRIVTPDEASPWIFTYLRVHVQEFGLQIIEGGLVQVKQALQRLICHALALAEEGYDLIEDCVKVHVVTLEESFYKQD